MGALGQRKLCGILILGLILGLMAALPGAQPVHAAGPIDLLYQRFFATGGPIGVAASRDRLFVSHWTDGEILQFDSSGNGTHFATIPFPGGNIEQYMAMAPTSPGGFTGGNLFVTQGNKIWEITPVGGVSLFATVGTESFSGTGIAFDPYGTFGYNMLVTMENGKVWKVNASRAATLVATVGNGTYGGSGTILENPAVAPPSFAPYGGQLLAASESHSKVYAISPTGAVSEVAPIYAAEAVHTIPDNVCTFGSTGLA